MIRIVVLLILLSASGLAAEDLQKRIDAASSGDTIEIAASIYHQPIRIHKGIVLKGRRGAILEVTSNDPAILVDTDDPIKIEGFTIRWKLENSSEKTQAPSALYVRNGKVLVHDCTFTGGSNTQQSPCAAAVSGQGQMDVKNCHFRGFEFTIQFWGGGKGTVEDCIIMYPGHCGITIGYGSGAELTGNIVTGSRYHGIRCTGGRIIARDNLVIRNRSRGFYLGNRSAVGVISNNLIVDNATGIQAYSRSRVTIENNVFFKSTYAGIALSDTTLLTICNNAFCYNENAVICFSEEEGRNPSALLGGKNLFFENKLDAEHIRLSSNSLTIDPKFKDPDNGDFSTASKIGLSKPGRLAVLWKKWQKFSGQLHKDTAVSK